MVSTYHGEAEDNDWRIWAFRGLIPDGCRHLACPNGDDGRIGQREIILECVRGRGSGHGLPDLVDWLELSV